MSGQRRPDASNCRAELCCDICRGRRDTSMRKTYLGLYVIKKKQHNRCLDGSQNRKKDFMNSCDCANATHQVLPSTNNIYQPYKRNTNHSCPVVPHMSHITLLRTTFFSSGSDLLHVFISRSYISLVRPAACLHLS